MLAGRTIPALDGATDLTQDSTDLGAHKGHDDDRDEDEDQGVLDESLPVLAMEDAQNRARRVAT